MSPTPFATLSARQQALRLRSVAADALRAFGIAPRRLALVNHGFNTTFRVDTEDGRRLALRINVNARRTAANLAAEVQWLTALAAETDLVVPRPLRTPAGEGMVTVGRDDLGRVFPAVLYSWLPGPNLSRAPTAARVREVGRAMATLHAHGATWRPNGGAALPALDDLFWGMPDRLDAVRLGLSDADHAVVRAALDRVAGHVAALFARGTRQPIHTDLHDDNLKWHRGRVAVFDFDDSGVGLPVQDLAVATYYRRTTDTFADAMVEGYQSVRALPSHSPEELEALVAHRNLLLLNDLVATAHPEHRAMIPAYVHNTVRKLRGFLDTGVYRHDVEGLRPLR